MGLVFQCDCCKRIDVDEAIDGRCHRCNSHLQDIAMKLLRETESHLEQKFGTASAKIVRIVEWLRAHAKTPNSQMPKYMGQSFTDAVHELLNEFDSSVPKSAEMGVKDNVQG